MPRSPDDVISGFAWQPTWVTGSNEKRKWFFVDQKVEILYSELCYMVPVQELTESSNLYLSFW